MIRILNAEPTNYSDVARQQLQSIGRFDEKEFSRQELIKVLPKYDILIVRLKFQVDREILDAGRKLKAVVSATTGLDHIDVDFARTLGIKVLSLKGEVAFLRTVPATAEHTWALLLSLIRRIPEAFNSVLRNGWDRDSFRGNDLFGKRLGIAGLGRIGEIVARYGKAFGMEVHGWDPYRNNWLQGVKKQYSLDNLLRVSDVLSLHVPLTDETQSLIGYRELQLLPKGAFLINTARGDLIDTSALLEALSQGRLAGAATDVVPNERDQKDLKRLALVNYAREHFGLIITPHIGGATFESMAKTEIFMAHKLIEWLNNKNF